MYKLETKKTHPPPRKVGAKVPNTILEKLLVILSRYREASIAVIAVVLVIYFQFGSNGEFLSAQFLAVVLRDTGRLGLIAVAEVMLMITGEIDLSVSSTFALAPYVMALMSVAWGVPLAVGAARRGSARRAGRRDQRHHYRPLSGAVFDHHCRHPFSSARHCRLDLQQPADRDPGAGAL